ncbi:O-antigen ligase domain-containing protein [Hymenobacter sediminis]|uniref:O-antigen ligase family protein n=1 Tax=Hymenobacter sediminis TaxID=2218621 RepID=UPI000DA6431A|nr:O-antigen ligase family protein [Hymenobacter sediminis]RPD49912.1 O-antigen ligase domain-containing protein [Hymenobacter sediminis]
MISFLSSFLTLQRLLIAAAFFCICTIVGLFTSSFFRILPSVGMVGILVTGLLSYFLHKHKYARVRSTVYGSFVAIYFLNLSSGLLTSDANWNEFERDVVLQLPFLILPLAFWLLPPLPAVYLRNIWLTLIGAAAIAALLSAVNYALHFEQINELYLHSKVMPTEPDHIRFSLIITLAIAAGILLIVQKNVVGRMQSLLVLVLIVLALYLHMLAVRSGLMAFYSLGVLGFLWLVLRKRNYYQAVQLALCLLLLPLVSYVCFPTFRNKSVNTQEDVGQVEHTTSANSYSLVGRVYSYKVALKVIRENFWFGVGKADIEEEMAVHYRKDFPLIQPESYIQPHNQYLYSTVAFGVVGLLIFVVAFYYPGLCIWPQYAPLLFAQYTIITLSFLVEYTLETQIGLAFALFFLMLALEGNKAPLLPDTEWRPA